MIHLLFFIKITLVLKLLLVQLGQNLINIWDVVMEVLNKDRNILFIGMTLKEIVKKFLLQE